MSDRSLPAIVTEFFSAIATRDADAISECFAEDANYYFLIPGPAVTGKENLRAMFSGLSATFEKVQWDIVKYGVDGDRVYVERVDRFWLPEGEFGIECVGVFELDNGLISEIRDYADMVTWRQRVEALVKDPVRVQQFLPAGNGLE